MDRKSYSIYPSRGVRVGQDCIFVQLFFALTILSGSAILKYPAVPGEQIYLVIRHNHLPSIFVEVEVYPTYRTHRNKHTNKIWNNERHVLSRELYWFT